RSVEIVLSMICGKTSHIVVMISGRFSTRAVKSSTPVSMICGIASRSVVTRLSISSGKASRSTGIASRTPSASPFMSWSAASISKGIFSISVDTMVVTVSTAAGMSV
ncbi:Hydroxymethylpyrimidine transporter CytX, partial [Dysosmobacter welbionis]